MAGIAPSWPTLGIALGIMAGMPAMMAGGQRDMDAPSARSAIVSPQSEGAASGGGTSSEFSRAADGLFYIDAMVNGAPVRFLVDTGASVIVLTPADAQRVGARIDANGYGAHVDTAGGKAAMAWTTLDHVTVAGRQVHQLRAAVVRNGLGVSLLGQNMLSKLALNIEGDSLRLR